MSKPRVWLITGASSGFGRAVAEVALAKGDKVVAAVRSSTALEDLTTPSHADQLLVLTCDVTRRDDISAMFENTYKRFGRCDVVFNNAGVGFMAEAENEEQDATARQMFEVNFWGAVNVTREAVRSFRELNPPGDGGLLLVNSSMSGQVGSIGGGFYSASKHALEGLIDSLVKEIDPGWRIRVSMIEPSAFKTRLFTEMTMFAPPRAYEDPKLATQQLRQLIRDQNLRFSDVTKAAGYIYSLSKEEHPPLRIPMGKPAVAGIGQKHRDGQEDIRRFESWSEDLELVG